jgi:hypothetical protein
MPKPKAVRKAPAESAKLFYLGDRKTGNDGNIWKIDENKNGVKRWVLVKKNTKALPSEKKLKTQKIVKEHSIPEQDINEAKIEEKKEISRYKKTVRERYSIPKKDAKYAVVEYLDFYKNNHARFLKYFKTLEEANTFSFKLAEKEVKKSGGDKVYFFGNKKIANKKAEYEEAEWTNNSPMLKPYKKQIIAYKGDNIISIVKPFAGVENEWKYYNVSYYPDAYFPSTTVFPIYDDEAIELPIHCINLKTRKSSIVKTPKLFRVDPELF